MQTSFKHTVFPDTLPFSYPPLWLRGLGMLSLVLFVALQFLMRDVGGKAESLTALLGLGTLLWYGKGIRGSGALWLLLAAILVQCLSWGLGYLHHPEWVADNPQIDRLAKLFIFVAVAWWLAGSTRLTLWVWGLAVVGFVLSTFTHDGALQEWWAGFHGQRAGFGVRNEQHGAMLFGVVLLGLVVFAPRWLRYRSVWSWLSRAGWGLLVVIALCGVLIGQTRAVWLGLVLSLGFVLMLWLVYLARQQSGKVAIKALSLSLLVVGILALAGIWLAQDLLVERVAKEADVIAQLAAGEIQDVPYSSIGIRIHTWIAATEWIAERPLVGWGGEGRGLVIEHTPWLPDFVKQNYGHLHNYFLEIWVAYGLIGVLVIATLAAWIGWATWRAWRAGVMPTDMALFGAAFFVYWIVLNQFESYDSFWTGVFVHNIIVGGLVTHYWRSIRQA
ncbi:O-antigen ligase family protein [Halomonas binhaiensis]|nr:O-antigen ligase family protein [Halomonas binhaiensis]